jgi:hypothetical protein
MYVCMYVGVSVLLTQREHKTWHTLFLELLLRDAGSSCGRKSCQVLDISSCTQTTTDLEIQVSKTTTRPLLE